MMAREKRQNNDDSWSDIAKQTMVWVVVQQKNIVLLIVTNETGWQQ